MNSFHELPGRRLDDYHLIESAIRLIRTERATQPGLDQLAARLQTNPWRLQRVFRRWTGISPKRFLQHLTLTRAKQVLREGRPVLEAALDAGLSGGSRLHDHFVRLESVTPGEYGSRGDGLSLSWGLAESPFGTALLGWTGRGLTWLAFVPGEAPERALQELRAEWPRADLVEDVAGAAELAARAFVEPAAGGEELRLLVRGTDFQVQVWRALLRIEPGQVHSYSAVAAAVGRPDAVRAVGSAIGANPISWLIPCHRVLRQNGALGGYRWGLERKQAMLAWESVRHGPAAPAAAQANLFAE